MEMFGITTNEIVQIMLMVGVLLVGLFLLQIFFRLTASLLRIGCSIIVILGILFVLWALFN